MFKLKKDDKVGIISPGGCIKPEKIADALQYLKKLGLKPIMGKNAFSVWHYMAGTDKQRAEDVADMFKNPQIKAIFCTRGGGGSQNMLPYLDFTAIKQSPKPVFGLSDITALQNALYTKCKIKSYTGFLLTSTIFKDYIGKDTCKALESIISGNKVMAQGGNCINKGETSGILIGGNLDVLSRLCGTPYFPNLSNKILLLEDLHEKTWKIDARLYQLSQQKGFDKLKGLIFGQFSDCIITSPEDLDTEGNIKLFCQKFKIPAICNFPYGHQNNKYILPIGAKIKFNATKCILEEL